MSCTQHQHGLDLISPDWPSEDASIEPLFVSVRVLRLFNLCDVDALPLQSPPKGMPPNQGLPPKRGPAKDAPPRSGTRDDGPSRSPAATVRSSPEDPAVLQGPEAPSAKRPLEPSATPQVQPHAADGQGQPRNV